MRSQLEICIGAEPRASLTWVKVQRILCWCFNLEPRDPAEAWLIVMGMSRSIDNGSLPG